MAEAIRSKGGAASVLPFDVRDGDAAKAALEADIRERGAYWGVVLNAGVARDNTFAAIPREDWE